MIAVSGAGNPGSLEEALTVAFLENEPTLLALTVMTILGIIFTVTASLVRNFPILVIGATVMFVGFVLTCSAGSTASQERKAAETAWSTEVVKWLDDDYEIKVDASETKNLVGDGGITEVGGDTVFLRLVEAQDGDLVVVLDGTVMKSYR